MSPARQCVVDRAMTQRHVRERTGRNDGREVEQYLALIGFRRGTPWCGAFVNWCYVQCGQPVSIRSPALAAAWLSDPKRLVWYGAKGALLTARARDGPPLPNQPMPGDVAGFRWQSYQIRHVEVVAEWDTDEDEDEFLTVGGNTSGQAWPGAVRREGVYVKRRQKEDALIANWLDAAPPTIRSTKRVLKPL